MSPEEFYLEHTGCKKPDVPQKPSPAQNVVLNELYAVKFTDDVYYRGKIVKIVKN